MKKLLSIVVLAITVVAGLMTYLMWGPDIAEFEHLWASRIWRMDAQKMVVVRAEGDPNVVGKEAFGQLFEIYFEIDGVSKGLTLPAQRARWPIPLETPKEEWVGLYALPVPESTDRLPQYEA